MARCLGIAGLMLGLWLRCDEVSLAQDLLEDAVKTKYGTPLKVVVRENAAVYEQPDETSRNRPVKMFQFFYVLKVDAQTNEGKQNGFYRIGASKRSEDFIGWIKEDKVVEWPHRQALGLRPKDNRKLLEFFDSQEKLKQAYQGQPVEPLSREPASGGGINLVPILESYEIDVAGDKVEAYHVAYMHSRNAGASSGGTSEVGTIDLAKSTLDVVFVIDSTASMQPFIDAAKAVVSRVAEKLRSSTGTEKVTLRMGVVTYRDVISTPSPDWYVTKLVCDLEDGANVETFQQRLGEVQAAIESSEDFPEDVFAGLKVAIQKSKWNPNAFKHIVLVGDASAHTETTGSKNSEKLTLEGVIALAQPRASEAIQQKIALHAIRVVGQESADHAACEYQFKTLANADGQIIGKYYAFDTTQTAEFVDKLAEAILESGKGLATAKSGAAPSSNTPALGLLLQMVRASETGGDIPHFASGHAAEIDPDGNLALEPYVLVEYGRLELFNSSLDFTVKALKLSGEPGSRKVSDLVQNMKNVVTGISLGEPLSGDTKLSTLLGVVLGVPVKSDIFDMTLDRLAAMSESDFQSWLKKVQASQSIIKSHLEREGNWFSLDKPVPLEKRYAFLSVKDLP